MSIATARRSYEQHTQRQLARDAAEAFPRYYMDDAAHAADMRAQAREHARRFVLAMVRAEGPQYLDGSHLSAILNSESPDDCQLVTREDFEEMRTYAVSAWKLLDEIIAATECKLADDPLGMITDKIRDARRFDNDFRKTDLNMPDVVANNE